MLDILELCGISAIMESIKKKINLPTIQSEEKQVYHANEVAPKKYSFRPQTLDQYIGQENAKGRINLIMAKIRTIKPEHILLFGTRGHGKTTLAGIVAKELDFNIFTYIGGSFTLDNFRLDFLPKCYESEKPSILFIDEIHSIKKDVAEYLYPAIEDFILPEGQIKIRKFCLIGATTNPEILQKKYAPLVDRCNSVNLEHYNADDIKKIIKQLNDVLYFKNISEDIYNILSVNARFNPRTSIQLFEDFLVSEDINKILKAHQIITNSLNINDIIVLKHLAEIKKPIGAEVLSIITQQSKQIYMDIQEPFLIQQGYISRTAKGRTITEKGTELLEKIK